MSIVFSSLMHTKRNCNFINTMRIAGERHQQLNPGVVSYHDLQDLVDTVQEIRQMLLPFAKLCTPRVVWICVLVWCFSPALIPFAIAGSISAIHLAPQNQGSTDTARIPDEDIPTDATVDSDSDRVMDDFVDVLGALCHVVSSTFSIVVSAERLRRNTDPSMTHRVVGWLLLCSIVLCIASVKAIICVAAVVCEINHWNQDWISLLTMTDPTKLEHHTSLFSDIRGHPDRVLDTPTHAETSVAHDIPVHESSVDVNADSVRTPTRSTAIASQADRQRPVSQDDMFTPSDRSDAPLRARSASFSNDSSQLTPAAHVDLDSGATNGDSSGDGGQWIVLTDATLGIPKPIQRPRSESNLSASSIAGAIAHATVRRRALARAKCTSCNLAIDTIFRRRVMCRHCGFPFCGNCCAAKVPRVMFGATSPAARKETVRVCNSCKDYLNSDAQATEWAGLEDGYFTPEGSTAAAAGTFL
eukprot:m.54664 g.54664  ORF g.54664 m.54664 type:complete len:471 (+) comp15520_c0_seq9:76-1488(+)